MRTKEEIKINSDAYADRTSELIIEILLDIRELLQKQKVQDKLSEEEKE